MKKSTITQSWTAASLMSTRGDTFVVQRTCGPERNYWSCCSRNPYDTQKRDRGRSLSSTVNSPQREDPKCERECQASADKLTHSSFRSRFLRETDRKKNGMQFPKLFYPELYLLDGGYKAFFAKYPVKENSSPCIVF